MTQALTLCAMLIAFAPALAQGPCARLVVSASPDLASTRESGPLDANPIEIENLYFHVFLAERVQGEHVVSIRIYTPNGHLYQQLDVPVTTDVIRANSTRKLPGYPRPLEVRVAQPSREAGVTGSVFSLPFPVAGTSITRNAVFGQWHALVLLDGSNAPCSEPAGFSIR